MKYAVVTTFHKEGYNLYASKMIDTFLKNWPKDVTFYAYHENVVPTQHADNLILRDLEKSSEELVKFKNKWKNVPKANGNVDNSAVSIVSKTEKKGFKWDAVRFAHKVYAIFHCAKNTDADVLIWMDADTVCHSLMTMEFLSYMMPNDVDIGFLGRKNKYTECGLYSLNLRSPKVIEFLKKFQDMYDDAENGIFTLKEWHDSFVFDAVRTTMSGLVEKDWSLGIIDGEGHPLINSEWGAYLDHLKGKRKSRGKSDSTDLKVKRSESYWN